MAAMSVKTFCLPQLLDSSTVSKLRSLALTTRPRDNRLLSGEAATAARCVSFRPSRTVAVSCSSPATTPNRITSCASSSWAATVFLSECQYEWRFVNLRRWKAGVGFLASDATLKHTNIQIWHVIKPLSFDSTSTSAFSHSLYTLIRYIARHHRTMASTATAAMTTKSTTPATAETVKNKADKIYVVDLRDNLKPLFLDSFCKDVSHPRYFNMKVAAFLVSSK